MDEMIAVLFFTLKTLAISLCLLFTFRAADRLKILIVIAINRAIKIFNSD